jgi:hypothetical protein
MPYFSAIAIMALVLSPLGIPVLVTCVHTIGKLWRR